MIPTYKQTYELDRMLHHAHALYEGMIALPSNEIEHRSAVWSSIVELQRRITDLLPRSAHKIDVARPVSAQERRRAHRHQADWFARYRLAAEDAWRQGRFLDVQQLGAAVEPFDVGPMRT